MIKLLLPTVILLVLSCQKKDKPKDQAPIQTESDIVVVPFKISVLGLESKPERFNNPEVIVQAQGYQSAPMMLTISTFSSNNPPPCSDYYFSKALTYKLSLKRNAVDTLILKNFTKSGQLSFQVKFIYDLTQSPVVFKRSPYGQSINPAIGTICDVEQGVNSISFGGY